MQDHRVERPVEDLEDGHDHEADESDYEPEADVAPVSGLILAGDDPEVLEEYRVTPWGG